MSKWGGTLKAHFKCSLNGNFKKNITKMPINTMKNRIIAYEISWHTRKKIKHHKTGEKKVYCVHVIATWFEIIFNAFFGSYIYRNARKQVRRVRVKKIEWTKKKQRKECTHVLKSIEYVFILGLCTLNESCFPHRRQSGIRIRDENKQIDKAFSRYYWWKLTFRLQLTNSHSYWKQ